VCQPRSRIGFVLESADDPEPLPLRRDVLIPGLPPLPRLPVVAALAVAVAVALGWGAIALAIHDHYLALRERGGDLGPLAGLFADASTPVTALTGWLAAVLFSVALRQLQSRDLEPPVGSGEDALATAASLRAGLRREYRFVVGLLGGAALATALDTGRFTVSTVAAVRGDAAASAGLGLMALECAGLAVAVVALALWARTFRTRIEVLGAL
jgi:hypothetical protein